MVTEKTDFETRRKNQEKELCKKLSDATGYKVKPYFGSFPIDGGFEMKTGVFSGIYFNIGINAMMKLIDSLTAEEKEGYIHVLNNKKLPLAQLFAEALEKEGFIVTIEKTW
jgi:ubiquinone/menaquinone biosynthesis C-methylase UbiE